MGCRPEWPSNNPSQGLVDALWDQIEAYWHDDPRQRPAALTVLQFLQRLSQERTQEKSQEPQEFQDLQESLEHVDDDGWDYMEDASELRPKEPLSLSGSTLVDDSIDPFFPGAKRDPSKSRRAWVGKRVRDLLHLSKSGLTTAESVGKPKPEAEIVHKHEEDAQVSDGSVPYLTSEPIPSGKRLKKVVITVVSKDQGWSSYSEDHGTYRNTWTWFELSVGRPSDEGFVERWRGEVVRNLHAHGEFKEHTIQILDKGLYEKAESGDVLTVWAHAQFPGWRNTVKKVMIRYVVE